MIYQIIDLEILDAVRYAEYVNRVSEIVRAHGGRYLVRGGKVHAASADWQPGRIVVIAFEDPEALQRCYASTEYRQIAPLREQSTRSKAVVVEGLTERDFSTSIEAKSR
jgi:uncharacterized protein (DUF1330 family)